MTVTNVEGVLITSDGGGASAAVSVGENLASVTTVAATNESGGSSTYSITGGTDSSMFTIDSSTGALSFITAPDYENPTDSGTNNVYDVTVQVSDGTLTDTQAIAVTVTNVNPEFDTIHTLSAGKLTTSDKVWTGANDVFRIDQGATDTSLTVLGVHVHDGGEFHYDITVDGKNDGGQLAEAVEFVQFTGTGAYHGYEFSTDPYAVVVEAAAKNTGATVTGTSADEFLAGSKFAGQVLNGGGGNDIILGGYPGDKYNYVLNGDAGNDLISGSDGTETITGGTGADVMLGGAGNDTFVFAFGDSNVLVSKVNADTIGDWGAGDKIDLGATSITQMASGGGLTVNAAGLVTAGASSLDEFVNKADDSGVAGAAVIWDDPASGSYLFISDGVAGLGVNDILIHIENINAVTGLTITSGDITGLS